MIYYLIITYTLYYIIWGISLEKNKDRINYDDLKVFIGFFFVGIFAPIITPLILFGLIEYYLTEI